MRVEVVYFAVTGYFFIQRVYFRLNLRDLRLCIRNLLQSVNNGEFAEQNSRGDDEYDTDDGDDWIYLLLSDFRKVNRPFCRQLNLVVFSLLVQVFLLEAYLFIHQSHTAHLPIRLSAAPMATTRELQSSTLSPSLTSSDALCMFIESVLSIAETSVPMTEPPPHTHISAK